MNLEVIKLLDPEIVAAIVAAIGGVAAAVVAGIRKLFKVVIDYLSELKPNGGGSIKDQVNRLEKRVDDIYKIIAQEK